MSEQATLPVDALPYEVLGHTDDPDWLEKRKVGIGASEAGAMLGLSPFSTPFQLWAQKTGLAEPPDLSDNEPVQWGKRLEQVIVQAFGERTGRAVMRAGELVRSLEHPWALATLDAWNSEDGRAFVPLEIKTTGGHHSAAWVDGPPDYYMAQIQQQLLVTGHVRGTYAVLLGGQRLVWDDVDRDDRWQRKLIHHGADFWRRVIEKDAPPPDSTKATANLLADLFPSDDGGVVELPGEFRETVESIADLRAQKRLCEDAIREAENKVKLALGKNQRGIFPGGLSVSWALQKRKGYSVAPGEHRVLRVHQPK